MAISTVATLTCLVLLVASQTVHSQTPSCESGCPVYIRAPDPVCGADGNTYMDECRAKCAGVEVVPCPSRAPCLCALIYKPVCGDGTEYGNECLARCAGAKHIVDGPCPCVCPKYYYPVCGSDGVTYDNPCFARCAGVACTSRGPCCPRVCPMCADVYEPVCVDGKTTYKNRCMTLCLCPQPKSIVPGECRPMKGRR